MTAAPAWLVEIQRAHKIEMNIIGADVSAWCDCDPSTPIADQDAHVAEVVWAELVQRRFVRDEPQVIPSRTTDPDTSHAAAKAVTVKAGTQRAYLLKAFAWANDRMRYGGALTDELAMELSQPLVSEHSEYSKRCSELREAGYIEPTGETRKGSSGMERIVSRITDKGLQAVKEL